MNKQPSQKMNNNSEKTATYIVSRMRALCRLFLWTTVVRSGNMYVLTDVQGME